MFRTWTSIGLEETIAQELVEEFSKTEMRVSYISIFENRKESRLSGRQSPVASECLRIHVFEVLPEWRSFSEKHLPWKPVIFSGTVTTKWIDELAYGDRRVIDSAWTWRQKQRLDLQIWRLALITSLDWFLCENLFLSHFSLRSLKQYYFTILILGERKLDFSLLPSTLCLIWWRSHYLLS